MEKSDLREEGRNQHEEIAEIGDRKDKETQLQAGYQQRLIRPSPFKRLDHQEFPDPEEKSGHQLSLSSRHLKG